MRIGRYVIALFYMFAVYEEAENAFRIMRLHSRKVKCLSESRISFYKKCNGSFPVIEFLDGISVDTGIDISAKMEAIAELNITAQKSHIRHIRRDLWEIRIRCYRIIFSYQDDSLLLLQGFHKKTNRTPDDQIQIAKSYLNDYLSRK